MCLTRLPDGVNSTIPRNALRKNASGVAMRMKIRQSKTPQLFSARFVTFAEYLNMCRAYTVITKVILFVKYVLNLSARPCNAVIPVVSIIPDPST